MNKRQRGGRSHTTQPCILIHAIDHRHVCRLNGSGQLLHDEFFSHREQARAATRLANKIGLNRFHGQTAGFFTGYRAPHTVRHKRQQGPMHRP